MLIKKQKLLIFIFILVSVFSCLLGCTDSSSVADTAVVDYICDEASFIKALQNGKSTVYLGDISFANPTEIIINYPIEIIGKPEKSVLENSYFTVKATNVPNECTDIVFRNIVLDGKIDKSDISFEEGKTFDEIVGALPQHHAIDASVGYSSLTLDRCEIRNYLHADGPAIYINNDTNYRSGKKALYLTDSKFYNNIAYAGTVKVFNDVLTTSVDGCEFFGNTARAGQGVSVGNGRSVISNTSIHDNDFFRFVYPMERRIPSIFHDDKKTVSVTVDGEKSKRTYNALGGCCGALFIGGSHATVDRCKIYNNKTLYGGGIGVINAESLEQNEKIVVKNTEIINNTALLCGGAVYLESYQGELTFFTDCKIIGNRAGEKGSVIYTTTYSPDSTNSYGGNVLFSFCTFADNASNDADTFTYYDLLLPELSGNISLKGCFGVDDSPYLSSDNDYTYLATKEQALADKVITEDALLSVSEKGLRPLAGSLADKLVPSSVYIAWSDEYSEMSGNRKIGAFYEGNGEEETYVFPYWTLIFPVVAVIGVGVFLVLYFKRKKIAPQTTVYGSVSADSDRWYSSTISNSSEQNEERDSENDTDSAEVPQKIDFSAHSFADIENQVTLLYKDVLTKREITIATYLLYGKTRKEIAQELFVTEDTVKTHLSHIFKKTGVSSKIELKKLIEEKLFQA